MVNYSGNLNFIKPITAWAIILLLVPNKKHPLRRFQILYMVRPAGIEPARLAPEASALSSELRALT